jgi:hypothetical protein
MLIRWSAASWPIASARRALAHRLDDALPRLHLVHPAAGNGRRVNVGLQTIAVDDIRGTAVAGDSQRARDFLPIVALRNKSWKSRWRRIEQAGRDLTPLPPIEVVQVGDGYWVVDGHHRVALARKIGQAFVDADVIAIRWAGSPPEPPTGRLALASVLESSTSWRPVAA